jgi:hypothetical protein
MDILSSGMLYQCVIFRSLANYNSLHFTERWCYTHKYHDNLDVGCEVRMGVWVQYSMVTEGEVCEVFPPHQANAVGLLAD